MSHSELMATFLKELLSNGLDSLNVNYYANVLKDVERLRESGDCGYDCDVLLNTIKYIFLLRLEKAIRYIRRYGEKPQVELPAEEAEVIKKVFSILERWQAEGSGEAEISTEKGEEDLGSEEGVFEEKRRFEGLLVAFLKPHPKILYEGGSIGPFSRGDIAYVPRKIAKELEEKGYVEIIE